MFTTLPAVQFSCKSARRLIYYGPHARRQDKRTANRHHRRVLNATTRHFIRDPEAFESECFNAPSFSAWNIC